MSKREVWCRKCEEGAGFLKKKYDGEFTHVDRGTSVVECRCDYCGKKVLPADPVSAVTMGRGDWSRNKTAWSQDYLIPDEVME